MSGYRQHRANFLVDTTGTAVGVVGRDGREWLFPAALTSGIAASAASVPTGGERVLYDVNETPVGLRVNGRDYVFAAAFTLNTQRGYRVEQRPMTLDMTGTPTSVISGAAPASLFPVLPVDNGYAPPSQGGAVVTPTITTQPTALSVTAPATATFTVVATNGGGTLTYQWRKGGTAISGATSASYTTPATTTGDSGSSFDCVVSNSAGSITTTAVSLTVAAAAADTRPRFGYAPANSTADQTAFASLFSGMTPLTGSSNAGRTGTFDTVSSTTNYTWIAVLHSAAPSGIRIYDGTGYGGFSGAASTGIYAGADTDPLTVHGTYTNSADGNVYDMYRGNGKASTFSTFTLS